MIALLLIGVALLATLMVCVMHYAGKYEREHPVITGEGDSCVLCDEGEADTATGPPDTPGGLTG